jgi:hypothetical protein
MKNNVKVLFGAIVLMWSISSFAGVLMGQWTEGTSRYCEYSDGSVIQISFGSTCSSTN